MVFLLKTLNKPFVESETTDELFESREVPSTQRTITRMDLLFFLLFSAGNNGHSIYAYFPTLLQYLAYRGGFHPQQPTFTGCDMNDLFKECNVSLSAVKKPGDGISVSSMMLYVQALSFFVQFPLFLTIGSLGDFGRINFWIVLASSILFIVVQFAPLALMNDDGSNWFSMAIILFLALISFNTCYTFFGASFPQLSDNLPIVTRALKSGHLSKDEAQAVVDDWRNATSLMMMAACYVGYLLLSSILYGVSYLPWSTGPFISDGHTLGDSAIFIFIATAVCGGFFLICSIPYIITKPKSVKGPPFPKDKHYLTYGWSSAGKALKEIRRYRQLFLCMVSYFLFIDALMTITELMSIITGQVTHFSPQLLTLMGVVMAISDILGCIFFYYLTERFDISPKTNLIILISMNGLLAVYGCIGIKSTTIGFRTASEVWIYCVWGFFIGPTTAAQQTVAVLLIPKGKENLFFGLFGVTSRASSWFGPLVVGAITQRTGNLWYGWPFIVGVFVVALGILYSVDMDSGVMDQVPSVDNTNKES